MPRPSRLRRIARLFLLVVILAAAAAAAGAVWIRGQLHASLPQLEGERMLPGLTGPVTVERDALGVPAIRGGSRTDVARALGFVHAQDRFFQMDLARRQAAGELSELLGDLTLPIDRRIRVHGLRRISVRALEEAAPDDRASMEAYAAGVNAGLDALGARPFEYLLLRATPAPWRPEDCLLVIASMFFVLQDSSGSRESARDLMHALLPPALFDFLTAPGGEWEAPIVGAAGPPPAVPPPDAVDVRRMTAAAPSSRESAAGFLVAAAPAPVPALAGSNNWAVAGSRTADGRALLANDMHLRLTVPGIWYRASLSWPQSSGQWAVGGGQEAAGGGQWAVSGGQEAAEAREIRVTGVTLPGVPAIAVGSNGRVAWGFTNTWGDWNDLVLVEVPDDRPDVYRTPGGLLPFERRTERIRVKGAPDEQIEVLWTIWGPVIDRDYRGRLRALRWVLHEPGGLNLSVASLETAGTLDEAIAAAAGIGIPAQNFVVADAGGRIGWTVAGRIPRRIGFDGRLPQSWADGSRRWDGWLPAEAYPRHVDPPSGLVWTANSRVVDGWMLEAIGDGGYDEGARARQIRDALLGARRPTAADMLAIQLDDRALLLDRWRALLLDLLTPDAVRDNPTRAEFRRLVRETWTGRASIDSTGYRLVRTFREVLARDVFAALTAVCREADARFDVAAWNRFEGPLWALVQERPPHLLPPPHARWEDQLLAAVDATIARLEGDERSLARRTWGERNTARIRHPLSGAVPLLSRWLDMPPDRLPGDIHMPRVQAPEAGASERMVVTPGREADGLLHIPAGQSGHPLSPHYRDSHAAWVAGEPTPFLPGPPVHTLALLPAP